MPRPTDPGYWKQTTQDIKGAFAAPPKPQGTPGAFIENVQRPTDTFANQIGEQISPTLGAFATGQLAGDMVMRGSEGDYAGAALDAPLLAMAMMPGAKRGKLPMDEASRLSRAKELGFNTERTLYHGTSTPKNFKEFKPSKDGYNELGQGVYFFDKPDAPGMYYYSGQAGGLDHGRIIPAYAKDGDLFDFGAFKDKQTNARERMLPEIINRFIQHNKLGYKAGDEDLVRGMFDHALRTRGDINGLLKEAGYVGGFDKYSQMPDQVVIFDPKDVRSKYAKFNPEKAGTAGIMAGGAGAFIAPGEPEDR